MEVGWKDISACSRDMTGLSNQALSAAIKYGLLAFFDARPTCIVLRPGRRAMVRLERSWLAFKAKRVMFARASSVIRTERLCVDSSEGIGM